MYKVSNTEQKLPVTLASPPGAETHPWKRYPLPENCWTGFHSGQEPLPAVVSQILSAAENNQPG